MINSLKNLLRRSLGVRALEDQINHLQQQQDKIIHLLESQKQHLFQEFVTQSQPGSILSCNINRMDMLAPVEMLHVFPHCMQPHPERKLTYLVETHCADWMVSHLNPGDVVLDIGAAFGVISLPLAKAVGESGHVYAFEPARRTQRFLEQILYLNEIANITVVKSAISDQPGIAEFIEYTSDNDLSWASDASTLSAPSINPSLNHQSYTVEVTTIDDFVQKQGIKPQTLKIDIEGFELYALHGAKSTLMENKPYLCIDIHKDVKTGESALEGVKPFLLNLGYDLVLNGHTLYGTPQR